MSKNFTVPVEPAKNTDVVVTERPFIPPSTTSISTSHQKPTGQKKGKKATQPVEAPGAVSGSQLVTSDEVSATQSVEAPVRTQTTCQLTNTLPCLLLPMSGLACSPVISKKPSVTSTGPTASVEEPEAESLSDRSTQSPDEGELSDRESVQEQEDLLEGDQEISAEQSYRETLRGVRSFMAWYDIPEYDSASSTQDDNPFTSSRSSQTSKVSVKVPVDDEWLCQKF